jgi:hypothetical protein
MSCCFDLHLKSQHLASLIRPIDSLVTLDRIQQSPTSHKFQLLIAKYGSRRCTGYRDKIYGLLGLAGGEIVNLIVPDYSTSVSALYEQVTLKLIENDRDLDIFSHLCVQYMKPVGSMAIKLPSWVPDWTSKGRDERFIDLQIRLQSNDYYVAPARSLASIKFIRQGKIALRGMLFSSFAVGELQDTHFRYSRDIFDSWEDVAEITKQPSRLYANTTCTTYYDAYWQTLCCSIAPSRSNIDGSVTERTSNQSFHRSWYDTWRDWCKIYHEDQDKFSSLSTGFTGAEINAFSHFIRVSTQMRRLFISKRRDGRGSGL